MASPTIATLLPNDNSNRAPGFISCVTITSVVAVILVSLRMYVRLGIVHRFGADDYTILLAMICCIVALCFNGLQVSQGFGQHVTHLTPQQQTEVRKWNFALEMPILVGSAISKISISLLLLRLLGNAAGRMRKYFLHGINVFVAAYTLLDIINNVVACTPTAKLWDLERPGTCRTLGSVLGITYFQGACSVAVALTLSSLPALFFGKLQLDPRTRVVVCLLMSLGVFDGVCSIVRSTLLPGYTKSLDFSYTAIPITIWGTLELNFAIIAACIPTLRPLFRYFNNSKVGTSHPTSRGFLKQNDALQDRAFHSAQTPGANAQYSLTSFEPNHSDSRSDRTTESLGSHDAIRKTTHINVEA